MKTISIVALMVIMAFGILAAEPLSTQYQQDLISRLEYLRGTGPRPASMDSSQGTPHCGTSILFDAYFNRDNLTAPYKQLAIQLTARPVLPLSFVSPEGHFLIHYTTTGSDSVYQSSNDTLVGGNLIPIYVYRIGQIADSVWNFEIGHLGYPTPPSDGSYPAGDGPECDIYILSLPFAYYGQTSLDSTLTYTTATSFIEIDNDYNFDPYRNRPLDAARVTIAHEFFHVIHFGMDYREFDVISPSAQLYWWEMSATWMEEMAYTNINDYYGYLPYFLDYPWVSLLSFVQGYSAHPYGSVLLSPLFVTTMGYGYRS